MRVTAGDWRRLKAISETISGAEIGICYASALCFAVRLVFFGAKTSPQDSGSVRIEERFRFLNAE